MFMTRRIFSGPVLGVIAFSGATVFCGGSPSSPSQSGTGGTGGSTQSCRTGVSTYRIVTVGPSLTSTTNGSCTFNAATVEGTCTNNYSDTAGTVLTSVSVTRHTSRGDVVDEVSVIPPLNRALGTTTSVTGTTGNSTGTSTLSYDSQRRLVTIAAVSQPGGTTSTTTYTAWDSAGRPTAGTQVSSGSTTAVTYAYNDSTRTQTIVSSGQTCTQTFDQNGNPSVGICGGATATTTVLTTQQICR
jgi:hypothetical protein